MKERVWPFHKWFDFLRRRHLQARIRSAEPCYLPLRRDELDAITEDFAMRTQHFATHLFGKVLHVENAMLDGTPFSGSAIIECIRRSTDPEISFEAWGHVTTKNGQRYHQEQRILTIAPTTKIVCINK